MDIPWYIIIILFHISPVLYTVFRWYAEFSNSFCVFSMVYSFSRVLPFDQSFAIFSYRRPESRIFFCLTILRRTCHVALLFSSLRSHHHCDLCGLRRFLIFGACICRIKQISIQNIWKKVKLHVMIMVFYYGGRTVRRLNEWSVTKATAYS